MHCDDHTGEGINIVSCKEICELLKKANVQSRNLMWVQYITGYQQSLKFPNIRHLIWIYFVLPMNYMYIHQHISDLLPLTNLVKIGETLLINMDSVICFQIVNSKELWDYFWYIFNTMLFCK